VIEVLICAGMFKQNKFQWRLGNFKVGISRALFVNRGCEHFAVEFDGPIKVFDIQGKLQAHFEISCVVIVMHRKTRVLAKRCRYG